MSARCPLLHYLDEACIATLTLLHLVTIDVVFTTVTANQHLPPYRSSATTSARFHEVEQYSYARERELTSVYSFHTVGVQVHAASIRFPVHRDVF